MNRERIKQLKRFSQLKPLEIKASKPIINKELIQKLILLEWQPNGRHFLSSTFFTSKQPNVKLHIFFNKKEKDDIDMENLRGSFHDSLILHESLTDHEEASWTDLIAFAINFYTKSLISCHHCIPSHPQIEYHVTLVTNKQGRYEEFQALLKSNNTNTKLVDGWNSTILDIFENVCHECKLIFGKKEQAEAHDKNEHNFLCKNKSCERSLRENGFYKINELESHESQQKICKYCPGYLFCDVNKYLDHMNQFHVMCSCPCSKYYRNTEEYIEHYFSLFPLPCLESPKCTNRFKNIDEQAFHHKSVHGSTNPYFCLACYSNSKLVCVKTTDELMSHVTTKGHTDEDFNIVIIPDE